MPIKSQMVYTINSIKYNLEQYSNLNLSYSKALVLCVTFYCFQGEKISAWGVCSPIPMHMCLYASYASLYVGIDKCVHVCG